MAVAASDIIPTCSKIFSEVFCDEAMHYIVAPMVSYFALISIVCVVLVLFYIYRQRKNLKISLEEVVALVSTVFLLAVLYYKYISYHVYFVEIANGSLSKPLAEFQDMGYRVHSDIVRLSVVLTSAFSIIQGIWIPIFVFVCLLFLKNTLKHEPAAEAQAGAELAALNPQQDEYFIATDH